MYMQFMHSPIGGHCLKQLPSESKSEGLHHFVLSVALYGRHDSSGIPTYRRLDNYDNSLHIIEIENRESTQLTSFIYWKTSDGSPPLQPFDVFRPGPQFKYDCLFI